MAVDWLSGEGWGTSREVTSPASAFRGKIGGAGLEVRRRGCVRLSRFGTGFQVSAQFRRDSLAVPFSLQCERHLSL